MFTLKVTNGPTVMLDPVNTSIGYKVSPISGIDVVTVSHEHSDHNDISLAPGSPKVLRGLAGSDWAKVDETIQGVRFRTVNTYHDDTQGSARGKNAVFVIEANNLRIVHLGDLGHLLTAEQVTAIGAVDVLLIPVGSLYTIDAARATQVVDSLKPRLVVPMHYKTPRIQLALQPVDAFLSG
ncbi:MAG: MBL fold metallo-hydrolase, partial [Chloroflexota bacterium]|nr:MBL fold metallo-hydrolase [Chloroflexota bacterium]